MKTLSLPKDSSSAQATERDRGASPGDALRIETQLLHFDGRLWHGYSYLWNEQQTDAELVAAEGAELTLPVDSGQRWRIHSRTECMQCHNPWPETTLPFTPEQLHQPDAGDDSEWLKLVRGGYVVTQDGSGKAIDPARCVRVALAHSTSESIENRARSYLHANCAHCHQNGAGAAVDLSLKITDDAAAMKGIDIAPSKGNFGVLDAKLIAPGDAAGSTLLFRMASSSIGRMPHIGSREVDFAAVALIAQWIDGMEHSTTGHTRSDNEPTLQQRAERLANAVKAGGAKEVASKELTPEEHSQQIRSAARLAIDLARQKCGQSSAAGHAQPLSPQLIAALAHSSDPLISSLLEAHVPARERQRRLGPSATYADVADVAGDARAGEAWFFDTSRAQCSKCHRVGTRGGMVGPELTKIGAKLTPPQIFEALADPSRIIDPKYQGHLIVLVEGKVISGLITEETPTQLTLVDPQGETLKIAVDDIEARRPDTKSIMPAGALNGLTAQQVADLLTYLSGLK